MPNREEVLTIEGLKTHFFTDEGVVRAVDGIDFSISRGRTLCVVGESGCGKSITARSVLGLIDPPGRVVDGNIWWTPGAETVPAEVPAEDRNEAAQRGRSSKAASRRSQRSRDRNGRIDLAAMDPRGETMRKIRGNDIAMIFQEPMASLSPMYTAGDQLVEAIRLHLPMSKKKAWEHGVSLLRRVGIPRPEQRMDAYPWQLSGGMCQRVMIAIALACEPSVLIADEPTTALDVTTQARIIDLLARLKEDTGMGMMFITHDLGVVAEVADDVVVMYLGTVVEAGTVDEVFHNPKHPYTQALLESIPRMGEATRRRLPTIKGQVPSPGERPRGCPYHPRCAHAIAGLCDTIEPPTIEFEGGGRARCVLHDPELLRSHEAGHGGPVTGASTASGGSNDDETVAHANRSDQDASAGHGSDDATDEKEDG